MKPAQDHSACKESPKKRRRVRTVLVFLMVALFAPILAAAPASADPCILYGFCGQSISMVNNTPPPPPTRTPTPVYTQPTYTQPVYATPVPAPMAAGIPAGWEGVWGRLSEFEKEAVSNRKSGRPYVKAHWNSAGQKKIEWEKTGPGDRNSQKRDPGSGHYMTGAAVGGGGLFALWMAAKWASPACGPFAPVCFVVL